MADDPDHRPDDASGDDRDEENREEPVARDDGTADERDEHESHDGEEARDYARATIANFYNIEEVHADAAHFGARGRSRRITGRLEEVDLREALAHYVTPTGSYEHAFALLTERRVVCLVGPTGHGKRAGAIALLTDAEVEMIEVLPPLLSTEQLAVHRFEGRRGYLIDGHTGAAGGEESEANWRGVLAAAIEADAYLVVTAATAGVLGRWDGLRPVEWSRPDVSDVLRAHLLGSVDHGALDELVQAAGDGLGADAPLRVIADVALALAGGRPLDDALALAQRASSAQVTAWFDSEPTDRDVVDVTALTFLDGLPQRTVETAQLRLATTLSVPVDHQLTQRRRLRVDESSLITTETDPGGRKRTPRFKAAEHRLLVLVELWDRYEAPFWDGVHDWIEGLISDIDAGHIAGGLYRLATIDPDEVEHLYLEPWSRGDAGPEARRAAVFVLWLLSADEHFAQGAFRLADRWSRSPHRGQRWTGALAFSGTLGRNYPEEAVNALWRFIVESGALRIAGYQLLANLFAELVHQTDDACAVIQKLEGELTKALKPARSDAPAVGATRAILAVRDTLTGEPSGMFLLRSQPATIGAIARLWSMLLRFGPIREDVLNLLLQNVQALLRFGDDRRTDVEALGHALGDTLAPVERSKLARQLDLVQARSESTNRPELLKILIAALEGYATAGGRS